MNSTKRKRSQSSVSSTHNAHKSDSGIDTDSLTYSIIQSDGESKREDFSTLKKSRKYVIKSELRDAVDKLFQEYKINDEADRADCLGYIEKGLVKSQPLNPPPEPDNMIQAQLNSLESLSDRNQLVRLLTHSDGALNEESLTLFPSLRPKSQHLIHAIERKTRSDKIDLEFISQFMHEYCRYDVKCFRVIVLHLLLLI